MLARDLRRVRDLHLDARLIRSLSRKAAKQQQPTRRPPPRDSGKVRLPPRQCVSLHNDLVRFGQQMEETPEEIALRDATVERAERVLRTFHPDASAHVFGSCLSGLRLPHGDIDLMIEAEGVSTDRLLSRFAKALRTEGVQRRMLTLPHARVPIVKWLDRETGVNVDACFNNLGGLRTTALLARASATHPEMRPLVLALKSQLLMHDLHQTRTGGIGGYLLGNMVRHILLHPPPPLPSAREDQAEEDLGGLLLRFYWYYGFGLDLSSSIVLPPRDGAGTKVVHPRTMDRNAHLSGRSGYLPHASHLLSLNDPLAPDVDIGAKAFNFPKVRRLLRASYKRLVEAIGHRERILGKSGLGGGSLRRPGGGGLISAGLGGGVGDGVGDGVGGDDGGGGGGSIPVPISKDEREAMEKFLSQPMAQQRRAEHAASEAARGSASLSSAAADAMDEKEMEALRQEALALGAGAEDDAHTDKFDAENARRDEPRTPRQRWIAEKHVVEKERAEAKASKPLLSVVLPKWQPTVGARGQRRASKKWIAIKRRRQNEEKELISLDEELKQLASSAAGSSSADPLWGAVALSESPSPMPAPSATGGRGRETDLLEPLEALQYEGR